MADLDEKAFNVARSAYAQGLDTSHSDCLRAAIRAYLDATPPVAVTGEVAGQREPRVRALRWNSPTRASNGCWTAQSIFGEYSLVNEDGWYACLGDGRWEWFGGRGHTLETAQAEIQDIHDRAILSALDLPAPTEGEGA